VTDWRDWGNDELSYWVGRDRDKRVAKYENWMIPPDVARYSGNVEVVFIQTIKTDRAEIVVDEGWYGFVRNIDKKGHGEKDKTYFEVILKKPKMSDDQLSKFKKYTESRWHVRSDELPTPPASSDDAHPDLLPPADSATAEVPPESAAKSYPDEQLLPGFVALLKETRNPEEFELGVYLMLRLLGIHRVFPIPQRQQAGKGDGFFRFANLAVIYDCTLSSDFEKYKEQQVKNYCGQLLDGNVRVPPNVDEDVKQAQKQVWIITKGTSRVLEERGGNTGIVIVKEIGIEDIKQLYLDRLSNPLDDRGLEKRLTAIGE